MFYCFLHDDISELYVLIITSISIIINKLTNSNPLTVDINEFVKQAISLTPNSVSPVLKSEITIYLDPT